MKRVAGALMLGVVLLLPARPQARNPFLGRWDFHSTRTTGFGANWMSVIERDGKLEVFFQPNEGHFVPLEDARINGSHMTLVVAPATEKNVATTWELDAAGGKITGVQKRGDQTLSLTGVRAPDLKRSAPAAWSDPVPLFNGKNLDGWEGIGNSDNIHWTVRDGMLINEEHGGNLRSTRVFDDFKLHFEVNCPARANSGFFLRGRYELQIAGGPGTGASPATGTGRAGGRGYNLPPNRSMGSVYGRIAPGAAVSTPPDGWDVFDVTLVGRMVTVVRNGVTTIDRKEIEGITGGALDANEGDPGPFYIQGDHTGNVRFRNITISVPKS